MSKAASIATLLEYSITKKTAWEGVGSLVLIAEQTSGLCAASPLFGSFLPSRCSKDESMRRTKIPTRIFLSRIYCLLARILEAAVCDIMMGAKNRITRVEGKREDRAL